MSVFKCKNHFFSKPHNWVKVWQQLLNNSFCPEIYLLPFSMTCQNTQQIRVSTSPLPYLYFFCLLDTLQKSPSKYCRWNSKGVPSRCKITSASWLDNLILFTQMKDFNEQVSSKVMSPVYLQGNYSRHKVHNTTSW